MEKEILLILGGLITIIGTVISVVITYYFTKKKEREAQWREEKMKYYIRFVNSLSGIMAGESSENGQRIFSEACNDIHLFAPKEVIISLHEFQNTIQASNPNIKEAHDEKLTRLLFAMRKDLEIKPKDKKGDWEATLWSSGNKPKPTAASRLP